MASQAADGGTLRLHRIQQTIKWIVYSLLIVNFAFYIAEDWNRAIHTLGSGASVLDWAAEFATSIDELGWFLLLFMFELETYAVEDEDWTGWLGYLVRGARVFCYVLIAHTVYAYAVAAVDLENAPPVAGVEDLCEFADGKTSYVFNLGYTVIDDGNCKSLSDGSRFFSLSEGTVVTDAEGLVLERRLAWVDVVEAVAWLLIVLAIETVVRLQDRGIARGNAITGLNAMQVVLYLLLIAFAVYWASLSHWLYFWDELLWIGGFVAIEMNLSEWRSELSQADAA